MDLSTRAMLVKSRIELKGLLGERKDKGATSHVEHTYNVAERRAKASKFLISQSAKSVRVVRASAQALRECMYRHTFAWLDTDMRLLPAKNHDQFREDWNAAQKRFDDAIVNFTIDYPSLVANAEHELGALFDASQYPPQSRIQALFRCTLEYWPFPVAGNFVADIADEAANEAREGMETKVREICTHAFNDIVKRSEDVVAHFVTKLGEYQPKTAGGRYLTDDNGETIWENKIQGMFRDSLVSNISDMAKLIRNLNFTDDMAIETLAVQLDRVARHSPDFLRSSGDVRKLAIDEGKQLLAKLEAMRIVDEDVSLVMNSAAADYL